ncbi:unnamed protein product [Arctogadus glacialis]
MQGLAPPQGPRKQEPERERVTLGTEDPFSIRTPSGPMPVPHYHDNPPILPWSPVTMVSCRNKKWGRNLVDGGSN